MRIVFLLVFVMFSCASTKRSPSSQPQETRVLFIGDSQTAGNLGKFTYNHLRTHFAESEIELYGVGSSSPRHWASTPVEKEGEWLCARKGRINGETNVVLDKHLCQG